MTEDPECVVRRTRGWWGEDIALHRCSPPYGPRNTVSNIAYGLAALWVVLTQSGDVRWVMALALCALAIGSWLYHSRKEIWANNLDWLGMGGSMAVLDVSALFPHSPEMALGAFSIGLVVALLISQHMHFDEVMAGMFLVALVPAYLVGDAGLAALSVLLFALGYLCWKLDKTKGKPLGLWGHALWHCFTAAAMAVLFAARPV